MSEPTVAELCERIVSSSKRLELATYLVRGKAADVDRAAIEKAIRALKLVALRAAVTR